MSPDHQPDPSSGEEQRTEPTAAGSAGVGALQGEEDGEQAEQLEALLAFIRDARGFDFTGYKRSTVGRRVRRRMQEAGCESILDYRDLLEADVDEFTTLFNSVLINLTGFFRDEAAWEYLESHVVPAILERHPGNEPIRVWSAGCSTGEEPYTLAMVFANAIGVNDTSRRVKIYATDVDLDALGQARTAVYTEKSLADVPETLRHTYFVPDAHRRGLVVIPPLRRTVVFGRLDLTRDPPISRVDLLACRNTLMYLNAETQSFVVPRLRYALRGGGFLFLGRAEMVLRGGAGRFNPVSLKHRIFVATPDFVSQYQAGPSETTRRPFEIAHLDASARERSLLERAALDEYYAELFLDAQGNLVGANDYAQVVLGLQRSDVARPFAELPIASSSIDLTEPLALVLSQGRSLDVGTVSTEQSEGDPLKLDVRMVPISRRGRSPQGRLHHVHRRPRLVPTSRGIPPDARRARDGV